MTKVLPNSTLNTESVDIDNDSPVNEGEDMHNWFLTLVKGTDPNQPGPESDIVTVTEFNQTGTMFATGDKGGRIVVFRKSEDTKLNLSYYDAYASFVSHEAEFDYLKSLEIEEKINKIKFLPDFYSSSFLLSTNDKTIKLWKIHERHKYMEPKYEDNQEQLCIPKIMPLDTPVVETRTKAVFKNGHTYHINSISLSSDGETFISSDDLRINLWNLEVKDQLYNIVDMKPVNMDDITEVITCCEFHPTNCSQFAYASSKGCIRLCDLRTSALCDQTYKLYELRNEMSPRNFFSEIISSVSDFRFSHDGRFMLTRDYMFLKVWDCRQQTGPVEQYAVHPYLKQKLCVMYENDFIFDKFDCCWSGDDRYLLTGSYGNNFTITDRQTSVINTCFASLSDTKMNSNCTLKRLASTPKNAGDSRNNRILSQSYIEEMDYSKRVLNCAWSPDNRCIAVGSDCNVYFYSNKASEEMAEDDNNIENLPI